MWPFPRKSKQRRLEDIYHCFKEEPDTGLHPTQIARRTGIGFAEVNALLEATPELFVKLPKREGITRYRLTSSMAVKSEDEVEAFLSASARKETLLLYAVGTMVLCILLIVIILIGPAV